jgi:hypothetical protein
MRSSAWRHYRGHLILKTRSRLFGLRRFEVWCGRTLLGTFRSVIRAELHVDRQLGARDAAGTGLRSGT